MNAPLRQLLPVLAFTVTPAVSYAEWVFESGEYETLLQDSRTAIKDEYATRDVVPRLEFRCTQGDATVIARIDWRRFISSFSTEVGFKVGDAGFTWLKWKVDGSEKVTYSPSGDDTAKLIGLLGHAGELIVEVSPYSEGPVTVSYDLAGLDQALEDLRERCR